VSVLFCNVLFSKYYIVGEMGRATSLQSSPNIFPFVFPILTSFLSSFPGLQWRHHAVAYSVQEKGRKKAVVCRPKRTNQPQTL
jgi:hypothetical protein